MATETLERPAPTDVDDDQRLTHIVTNEAWELGYLYGQEVEALCGYRWVPSRDPERYPVCQPCVEVAEQIRGGQ